MLQSWAEITRARSFFWWSTSQLLGHTTELSSLICAYSRCVCYICSRSNFGVLYTRKRNCNRLQL